MRSLACPLSFLGIDRIETPLPFTDAGFFAHRLPSNDSPGDKLPSRAQCVARAGSVPPSQHGRCF